MSLPKPAPSTVFHHLCSLGTYFQNKTLAVYVKHKYMWHYRRMIFILNSFKFLYLPRYLLLCNNMVLNSGDWKKKSNTDKNIKPFNPLSSALGKIYHVSNKKIIYTLDNIGKWWFRNRLQNHTQILRLQTIILLA